VLGGCGAPRTTEAPSGTALLLDGGGVLGREARQRLEDYLRWVRTERGIDYRVVLESVEASPEVAAADRYRELTTGETTEGRSLLLWVDPSRRLARVEVGYALEPFLTDLDASRMIADFLAPRFDGTELGPGLEAAVEALVEELRTREGRLAEATVATTGSGGGGATRDLAAGPPGAVAAAESAAEIGELLVPQPDPRAARDLELAMLHRGVYLQQARLYDDAWRRARRPGHWSPERLREIAREWDQPYEVLEAGDRAIAYAPDHPAIGPTLLFRDEEGWRIDATAGARLVVYDYSNDGWFFIDEPGSYLDLARRAYTLRRVNLQSGRRAWEIADR
jgi:uncharacterized membrane protein YgcG